MSHRRLTSRLMVPLLLIISLAIMVISPLMMWQNYSQQLRHEADSIANMVIAFRHWIASSKMVWVDQLTPLSPDYLVRREHGEKVFYGKNPALATRELANIFGGYRLDTTFRVTSDNPRNPANLPDPFDREAIETFRLDERTPYVEAFEQGGYRYAQPLWVTRACLGCHGDPANAPREVIEKYGDQRAFGYQVGDLRGVISIRISSPPLFRFIVDNWQTLLMLLSFGLVQLILISLLPWWRRQ